MRTLRRRRRLTLRNMESCSEISWRRSPARSIVSQNSRRKKKHPQLHSTPVNVKPRPKNYPCIPPSSPPIRATATLTKTTNVILFMTLNHSRKSLTRNPPHPTAMTSSLNFSSRRPTTARRCPLPHLIPTRQIEKSLVSRLLILCWARS